MANQKFEFNVDEGAGKFSEGDKTKIGLRLVNKDRKVYLENVKIKITSTKGCSVSPSRFSVGSVAPESSWQGEVDVSFISEGFQNIIFRVEGVFYQKRRVLKDMEIPFSGEVIRRFKIRKVPLSLCGSIKIDEDTLRVGQPFTVEVDIQNESARTARIEADCKLPFNVSIVDGESRLSTKIPPKQSVKMLFRGVFSETTIPSEYFIGPVYVKAFDELGRGTPVIIKEVEVRVIREEAKITVSKKAEKETIFVGESTSILVTLENQSNMSAEVVVKEITPDFVEIVDGSQLWEGVINPKEKIEVEYTIRGVGTGSSPLTSVVEYKLPDGTKRFLRTQPLAFRVVERSLNAKVSVSTSSSINVKRGDKFAIRYSLVNIGEQGFDAALAFNKSLLVTLEGYNLKKYHLEPGEETIIEAIYTARKDGREVFFPGRLTILSSGEKKQVNLPLVTINVSSNYPEIDVSAEGELTLFVGDTGCVEFKLKNRGSLEAKDVLVFFKENLGIVEFPDQQPLSFETINSAEEITLSVPIKVKRPGNTRVEILVEYSDFLDEHYSANYKVKLRSLKRKEKIEVYREVQETSIKSGEPFDVFTRITNAGDLPISEIEIEEPLKLPRVILDPERQFLEKLESGEEATLRTSYIILTGGEFKILGAKITYIDAGGKKKVVLSNDITVMVEPSEPNIRVSAEPLEVKIGDSSDLVISVLNDGPVPIYRFSLNVPQSRGNFGDIMLEQVPFILSIDALEVRESRVFRYRVKGMKVGEASRIFSYVYHTPEGEERVGELKIEAKVSSRPHSISIALRKDRNVYEYGEPFTLIVDITNKSEKPVKKVNVSLQEESTFIVSEKHYHLIEHLSPKETRTVFFSLTPIQAGTLNLKGITARYEEEGVERVLLSSPLEVVVKPTRKKPKRKGVYSRMLSKVEEDTVIISVIVENSLDEPVQNVTITLESPDPLRIRGPPVKMEPFIDSGEIIENKFEAEIVERNVKARLSARVSYRNSRGEVKLIDVKPILLQLL